MSVHRVCASAVSRLLVTGAGVTLVDRVNHAVAAQGLVWASDTVATRLEDLQLTVGEGPGLAAVESDTPVLVPDLLVAARRWPAFTPAARELGVAAVFAFPLVLGGIRLGSLDCYRTSPGPLNQEQLGTAGVLAESAFAAVLAAVAGHVPDDLGWIGDLHVEVHQACGMVRYQLGTTLEVALLRIRAHAYSHDLPLAVVANRIVNGRLRLHAEQ